MIMAGNEPMLMTSASVAQGGSSLEVAVATDGFAARHPAKVVGTVPEVNLVLL